MSSSTIEVDEDLPPFFSAIRLTQSEELCAESDNIFNTFGFEYTDPDTIEALRLTSIPEKSVQGTPWYQVLSNPFYADMFQYIGAFVAEREKLIEDGYEPDIDRYRFEQSDMVMILLNLAYIPDEVVRTIRFDQCGWSRKLKEAMDKYKDVFNKIAVQRADLSKMIGLPATKQMKWKP